jgi:hypothetical protein
MVMVLSYGKPGHQGQLEGLGTIVLFASRGLLLGTRVKKFLLVTVRVPLTPPLHLLPFWRPKSSALAKR